MLKFKTKIIAIIFAFLFLKSNIIFNNNESNTFYAGTKNKNNDSQDEKKKKNLFTTQTFSNTEQLNNRENLKKNKSLLSITSNNKITQSTSNLSGMEADAETVEEIISQDDNKILSNINSKKKVLQKRQQSKGSDDFFGNIDLDLIPNAEASFGSNTTINLSLPKVGNNSQFGLTIGRFRNISDSINDFFDKSKSSEAVVYVYLNGEINFSIKEQKINIVLDYCKENLSKGEKTDIFHLSLGGDLDINSLKRVSSINIKIAIFFLKEVDGFFIIPAIQGSLNLFGALRIHSISGIVYQRNNDKKTFLLFNIAGLLKGLFVCLTLKIDLEDFSIHTNINGLVLLNTKPSTLSSNLEKHNKIIFASNASKIYHKETNLYSERYNILKKVKSSNKKTREQAIQDTKNTRDATINELKEIDAAQKVNINFLLNMIMANQGSDTMDGIKIFEDLFATMNAINQQLKDEIDDSLKNIALSFDQADMIRQKINTILKNRNTKKLDLYDANEAMLYNNYCRELSLIAKNLNKVRENTKELVKDLRNNIEFAIDIYALTRLKNGNHEDMTISNSAKDSRQIKDLLAIKSCINTVINNLYTELRERTNNILDKFNLQEYLHFKEGKITDQTLKFINDVNKNIKDSFTSEEVKFLTNLFTQAKNQYNIYLQSITDNAKYTAALSDLKEHFLCNDNSPFPKTLNDFQSALQNNKISYYYNLFDLDGNIGILDDDSINGHRLEHALSTLNNRYTINFKKEKREGFLNSKYSFDNLSDNGKKILNNLNIKYLMAMKNIEKGEFGDSEFIYIFDLWKAGALFGIGETNPLTHPGRFDDFSVLNSNWNSLCNTLSQEQQKDIDILLMDFYKYLNAHPLYKNKRTKFQQAFANGGNIDENTKMFENFKSNISHGMAIDEASATNTIPHIVLFLKFINYINYEYMCSGENISISKLNNIRNISRAMDLLLMGQLYHYKKFLLQEKCRIFSLNNFFINNSFHQTPKQYDTFLNLVYKHDLFIDVCKLAGLNRASVKDNLNNFDILPLKIDDLPTIEQITYINFINVIKHGLSTLNGTTSEISEKYLVNMVYSKLNQFFCHDIFLNPSNYTAPGNYLKVNDMIKSYINIDQYTKDDIKNLRKIFKLRGRLSGLSVMFDISNTLNFKQILRNKQDKTVNFTGEKFYLQDLAWKIREPLYEDAKIYKIFDPKFTAATLSNNEKIKNQELLNNFLNKYKNFITGYQSIAREEFDKKNMNQLSFAMGGKISIDDLEENLIFEENVTNAKGEVTKKKNLRIQVKIDDVVKILLKNKPDTHKNNGDLQKVNQLILNENELLILKQFIDCLPQEEKERILSKINKIDISNDKQDKDSPYGQKKRLLYLSKIILNQINQKYKKFKDFSLNKDYSEEFSITYPVGLTLKTAVNEFEINTQLKDALIILNKAVQALYNDAHSKATIISGTTGLTIEEQTKSILIYNNDYLMSKSAQRIMLVLQSSLFLADLEILKKEMDESKDQIGYRAWNNKLLTLINGEYKPLLLTLLNIGDSAITSCLDDINNKYISFNDDINCSSVSKDNFLNVIKIQNASVLMPNKSKSEIKTIIKVLEMMMGNNLRLMNAENNYDLNKDNLLQQKIDDYCARKTDFDHAYDDLVVNTNLIKILDHNYLLDICKKEFQNTFHWGVDITGALHILDDANAPSDEDKINNSEFLYNYREIKNLFADAKRDIENEYYYAVFSGRRIAVPVPADNIPKAIRQTYDAADRQNDESIIQNLDFNAANGIKRYLQAVIDYGTGEDTIQSFAAELFASINLLVPLEQDLNYRRTNYSLVDLVEPQKQSYTNLLKSLKLLEKLFEEIKKEILEFEKQKKDLVKKLTDKMDNSFANQFFKDEIDEPQIVDARTRRIIQHQTMKKVLNGEDIAENQARIISVIQGLPEYENIQTKLTAQANKINQLFDDFYGKYTINLAKFQFNIDPETLMENFNISMRTGITTVLTKPAPAPALLNDYKNDVDGFSTNLKNSLGGLHVLLKIQDSIGHYVDETRYANDMVTAIQNIKESFKKIEKEFQSFITNNIVQNKILRPIQIQIERYLDLFGIQFSTIQKLKTTISGLRDKINNQSYESLFSDINITQDARIVFNQSIEERIIKLYSTIQPEVVKFFDNWDKYCKNYETEYLKLFNINADIDAKITSQSKAFTNNEFNFEDFSNIYNYFYNKGDLEPGDLKTSDYENLFLFNVPVDFYYLNNVKKSMEDMANTQIQTAQESIKLKSEINIIQSYVYNNYLLSKFYGNEVTNNNNISDPILNNWQNPKVKIFDFIDILSKEIKNGMQFNGYKIIAEKNNNAVNEIAAYKLYLYIELDEDEKSFAMSNLRIAQEELEDRNIIGDRLNQYIDHRMNELHHIYFLLIKNNFLNNIKPEKQLYYKKNILTFLGIISNNYLEDNKENNEYVTNLRIQDFWESYIANNKKLDETNNHFMLKANNINADQGLFEGIKQYNDIDKKNFNNSMRGIDSFANKQHRFYQNLANPQNTPGQIAETPVDTYIYSKEIIKFGEQFYLTRLTDTIMVYRSKGFLVKKNEDKIDNINFKNDIVDKNLTSTAALKQTLDFLSYYGWLNKLQNHWKFHDLNSIDVISQALSSFGINPKTMINTVLNSKDKPDTTNTQGVDKTSENPKLDSTIKYIQPLVSFVLYQVNEKFLTPIKLLFEVLLNHPDIAIALMPNMYNKTLNFLSDLNDLLYNNPTLLKDLRSNGKNISSDTMKALTDVMPKVISRLNQFIKDINSKEESFLEKEGGLYRNYLYLIKSSQDSLNIIINLMKNNNISQQDMQKFWQMINDCDRKLFTTIPDNNKAQINKISLDIEKGTDTMSTILRVAKNEKPLTSQNIQAWKNNPITSLSHTTEKFNRNKHKTMEEFRMLLDSLNKSRSYGNTKHRAHENEVYSAFEDALSHLYDIYDCLGQKKTGIVTQNERLILESHINNCNNLIKHIDKIGKNVVFTDLQKQIFEFAKKKLNLLKNIYFPTINDDEKVFYITLTNSLKTKQHNDISLIDDNFARDIYNLYELTQYQIRREFDNAAIADITGSIGTVSPKDMPGFTSMTNNSISMISLSPEILRKQRFIVGYEERLIHEGGRVPQTTGTAAAEPDKSAKFNNILSDEMTPDQFYKKFDVKGKFLISCYLVTMEEMSKSGIRFSKEQDIILQKEKIAKQPGIHTNYNIKEKILKGEFSSENLSQNPMELLNINENKIIKTLQSPQYKHIKDEFITEKGTFKVNSSVYTLKYVDENIHNWIIQYKNMLEHASNQINSRNQLFGMYIRKPSEVSNDLLSSVVMLKNIQKISKSFTPTSLFTDLLKQWFVKKVKDSNIINDKVNKSMGTALELIGQSFTGKQNSSDMLNDFLKNSFKQAGLEDKIINGAIEKLNSWATYRDDTSIQSLMNAVIFFTDLYNQLDENKNLEHIAMHYRIKKTVMLDVINIFNDMIMEKLFGNCLSTIRITTPTTSSEKLKNLTENFDRSKKGLSNI